MSIEKIIKMVLKEQNENVAHMAPQEFLDILPYVNNDVSNLLKLPNYRNKKIVIDGHLDLSNNKEIKNLNLISKINGHLDIKYSGVDVFDDSKANGITDYGSKRAQIRKQKELQKKFDYLDELRREEAWDVENGRLISYETDALYQYLKQRNIPQVISDDGDTFMEDKYYIYPEKYDHYGGKFFTWLGEDEQESEFIVYDNRNIENNAHEAISSRIDELGYDAFSDWVWNDHLDSERIREWLTWYIEEPVRDQPDEWGIEEMLSDEQERYIEIYETKIKKLEYRIRNENISEDVKEKLEEEINDIQEIIDDIRENPKGGYNEDDIEDRIERWVDNNEDDFISLFRDAGYSDRDIIDYVDVEGVIDFVINHDSWGEIFGSYDGDYDENEVDGLTFVIMRYN